MRESLEAGSTEVIEGLIRTTPRYIKICGRLVDRKKIEEIYDYFKSMDRGNKGYVSLQGRGSSDPDY